MNDLISNFKKDSNGRRNLTDLNTSKTFIQKNNIEYSLKPFAPTHLNETLSEYESDDSYACDFSRLIKCVKVNTKRFYPGSESCNNSNSRNKIAPKNGNLFKVVILKNRANEFKADKRHLTCVFLVDCQLIDSSNSTAHQNEIFCYWNDEQNKLEHNDQLLSINGIYFEQFDFDNAYQLLSTYFVTNTKTNSNYQQKGATNKSQQRTTKNSIELLISRDINQSIVNKYNRTIKNSNSNNSNYNNSNSRVDSIRVDANSSSVCSLLFYDQQDDLIFCSSPQMKAKEKIMVLNTEWTQLETIELLNETNCGYSQQVLSTGKGSSVSEVSSTSSMSTGTGFGFGITGNKSTGVVVKAVTIGGSAYKDGRLRINDQIFQIGDTNVRSMSSEQVASVLRQSSMHGKRVKFIVARPVHNNITDIELVGESDSYELKNMLNDLNGAADNPNSESFILKTCDIMDNNVNLVEKLDIEKKKRVGRGKDAAKQAEASPKKQEVLEPEPSKTNVDISQDNKRTRKSDQEKEFKNDLTAPCEMPVKTSTPIRHVSENPLCENDRIYENTALVESMIENEQLDNNTTNNSNNKDAKNSSLCNEEVKADRTLKIEEDDIEYESQSDPNDPNLYCVKLVKNKRSDLAETDKRVGALLEQRDSMDPTTNLERRHATSLEACSIFLKENYNISITHEKLAHELVCPGNEKIDGNKSTDYYYIKEMQEATTLSESFVIEFQSIEPYNQILEINSKSIEEYVAKACARELDSTSVERHITIKLVRNMDLVVYKLKQKWKQILDESNYLYDDLKCDLDEDNYEIIVSRIDKTKTRSLGFSLEGTVDIDDNGVETCAHHYIRSIMQNGPTDKAIPFKLEPGDELLEIDSKRLYAINYLDLLNILKALSYKFVTIVCARKKLKPLQLGAAECNEKEEEDGDQINRKLSVRAKSEGFLLKHDNEDVNGLKTKANNDSKPVDIEESNVQNNKTTKVMSVSAAKSTPSLVDNPSTPQRSSKMLSDDPAKSLTNMNLIPRSRSLEQTSLAMWQQKVSYIYLTKSVRGLGFSLIDYQHSQFTPLSKTMIVIRALVPSGVAQADGKLRPGQRLVSVNDVCLDDDLTILATNGTVNEIDLASATKGIDKTDLLNYTVAILKSLPSGVPVRLGVQKPLPYPKAIGTIRPSRAKSQHFNNKTELSKSSKNIVSTEPLPRKKKKKNLKRRKKIITTSQYDLKSDDESEAFSQVEDGVVKKNKNCQSMLKTFDPDSNNGNNNHYNQENQSKSEYEETENSTALQDESSMTLSSAAEEKQPTVKAGVGNTNENNNLADVTMTSVCDDEKEEPNGYGLAATSAPAILNDLETLENERFESQKHFFYSTSSLLRAQSKSMLSKRTKSDFDLEQINSERFKETKQKELCIRNEKVQSEDETATKPSETNDASIEKKQETSLSIQNLVSLLQNSDIPFTVSNVDEDPVVDDGEDDADIKVDTNSDQPKGTSRKSSETKIVNSEQLLSKLISQQADDAHLKQQKMSAIDFVDSDCIMMEKIYDDDNNKNLNGNIDNNQLITEAQFEKALIINASKNNLNFKLITNSTEDLTNDEEMNIEKDCQELDLQMSMESDKKAKSSDKSTKSSVKSHKTSSSKKSKLLELEAPLAEKQPELNNELESAVPKSTAVVSSGQAHLKKKKRSSSAKNIGTSDKSKSAKKHRKHRRSPSITDSRSLHGDRQEPTTFGNYSLSRTVPTSIANMASRVPSRCNSIVKVLNILGADIVKFPVVLEKEVKIKKNFDPLGITSVDCFIDHGINGCAILKIEPNSACSKDKTLDCGDYLLNVNNENMRNVSNSKARSILNRASLTSSDVTVRYISLDDAIAYVEDLNKTYHYSFPVNNKLYQTHKRAVTLAKQESKSVSSEIGSDSKSTTSMSLSLSNNSINSLTSSHSCSCSCSHCSQATINNMSRVDSNYDNKATSDNAKREQKTDKQVQLDPRLQGKMRYSRRETSEAESKKTSTTKERKEKNQNNNNATTELKRTGKISLDSKQSKSHKKSNPKGSKKDKEYDQDTDDYGEYSLNNSSHTTEPTIISQVAAEATTSKNQHHITKNYAQSTKLEKISSESGPTSSVMSPVSDELASSIWGPARRIILKREPNKSLGISIVGGKLDISTKDDNNNIVNESEQQQDKQQSSFISGIFIKHVLENSPAGVNGTLHTGDRILAVGGVDLTNATHDKAVEVIKNSKSPIEFVIQSLLINESGQESVVSNPTDESILSSLSTTDSQCLAHDTTSNSETDMTEFDHQFYEDNYYNYNLKDLRKKYSHLIEGDSDNNNKNIDNYIKEEAKASILIFRLERTKPNQSLGLSLSGNNDLSKTSVFVCDISPVSPAHTYGSFRIGDQILEINGKVIYGRAHCNVTPIVRSINELVVYVVVLRDKENLKQMYLSKFAKQSPSDSKPNSSEVNTSKSFGSSEQEVSSPSKVSKKSIEQSVQDNVAMTLNQQDSKKVNFKVKDKPRSQSQSLNKNTLIKLITLRKSSGGFGIAISEDRHHRLIIRGLNPTGIAQKDGRLHIGDEIIKVNSVDVKSMSYDDIMNLLHSTTEPVEFCVKRSESDTTTTTADAADGMAKGSSSTSTSDAQAKSVKERRGTSAHSNNSETMAIPNDNPRTDPIRLCQETWIEIERGKMGLGLSIVGGSDTQLLGIIIHDIYQSGAAFVDKRLAIGDQILCVNDIDLTSATHEQALNALRQTSDYVRLLVHRGFLHSNNDYDDASKNQQVFENKSYYRKNFIDDEQYLNILTIDLVKKFAKGLGFSIIGRRDGSGVFLSHIIEGGCAHKDGRLMVGDLLLEVNSQDIRMSPYNDVAFLLKTLPQGKVSLKIGRFRTSACQSQSSSANTSNKTSRRNSITVKL